MSERKWTPSQEDAINARGGSVLVSAAAGSGKTAVLVERIISLITDEKNPIDADRILVVTFTNAAAAEMKDRIARAISNLIYENPDKSYLRRQQMLLDKAQISTVHSFCMSLISENFQKLNIPPDFTIADANRIEVFKNQAINEILEEIYENESEIYEALSEIFSLDKNDKNLIDMILRLDNFISSCPFPNSWLSKKTKMYKNVSKVSDTVWGEYILEKAEDSLKTSIDIISECLDEALLYESVYKAYGYAFETDLLTLENLYNAAKEKDWDKLYNLLSNVTKEKLKPSRDKSTEHVRNNLKTRREQAFSVYKDIRENLVAREKDCLEDIEKTAPFVDALFTATKMFRERFTQIKRSKNTLDFGDLEHLAIELLVKETDNGYEKTEYADALSKKYDEIMVDEYQDTNEAQELIFSAISKNEENLFTVGDLKQSIYGFRQAMPELFINRKERYTAYKKENPVFPASISLDKNFRSRENVTETVNFFFNQLMTKESASLEYKDGEQLSFGAQYYENEDPQSQIVIFNDSETEDSADITEARWIAQEILRMQRENVQVRDSDTGLMRTVRPGDVCVLLRSYKNHAPAFLSEMKKYGLDVVCEAENSFFDKKEISFMVSLLRVVDNPMQDIALLGVMMSVVYGFTADDIALMRMNSPKARSLYEALLNFSNEEKFASFIEKMEQLRFMAAQMSVSQFITTLYSVTGFSDIVLAMPQGEIRLENLRTLESYAKSFDSFSQEGLHGFVKYLDRLEEQKSKFTEKEESADADSVKLMSVHKSKGLEFPICILAGCARGFNKTSSDSVLDMKFGFAVKLRGYNGIHRYSSFVREAVQEKINEDGISEELRLLYVALTRAKEKLIMLCSIKKPENKLNTLSFSFNTNGEIRSHFIKKAGSISDWLLMCALRHPQAQILRELSDNENIQILNESKNKLEISVISSLDSGLIKQEEENETKAAPDKEFILELEEKFKYEYPYGKLRFVPSKISASGMAESKNNIRSFSRPAFLSSKGVTPAERGTAIHEFMQYCDLKNAREDAENEITRLKENGFITEIQAEVIDREKLSAFFKSEISKKMENAENCKREYRFTSRISANELYPEKDFAKYEQDIILQGAIDCLIEEDDGVIIIDYKTDRVKNEEELTEHYILQLELYKKAAEKIFNKTVKSCFIYSFHLNKTISVF